MGKFKDKLDSLGGGEKYNNPDNGNPDNGNPGNGINKMTNGDAEKCEPGRTINFKTQKEVPTPPTPGVPPPGEGVDADKICDCVTVKFDELIDDVRNTYPYGPSFNTGKLFTQAYTPFEIDPGITQPSPDLSIKGFYDEVLVAPKRNNANARQIWVIADPDGNVNSSDPFLYVRTSTGANAEFSVEVPVRVGEDWEFRDVYAFRIRASAGSPITGVGGQQYRITTDPHHTTFVSTIVNVPTGTTATTPPVANRSDFIAINVPVGIADSVLSPSPPGLISTITIPNGFALVVTANIDNSGTSRIFISRTNALSGNRVTLAPGDAARLNITTSDIIHVAANVAGQSIDILVEQ